MLALHLKYLDKGLCTLQKMVILKSNFFQIFYTKMLDHSSMLKFRFNFWDKVLDETCNKTNNSDYKKIQ